MKLKNLHPWDVSVEEAKAIQFRLASLVSHTNGISSNVRYVAGVDISPPDSNGTVRGAVVVLNHPGLEIQEVSMTEARPGLPYIPGLLSFRETPVLMGALEQLELAPDIIMVDGQGLAHPRRFGIACHIGLLTDIPTIGCAKSILTGRHKTLDREAGSQAELIDQGEILGIALRTRTDARPVYVSIGHKIDLPTAVHWVMACCRGKRLPEPTRLAHEAAAGHLAPQKPHKVDSPRVEQGRLFY